LFVHHCLGPAKIDRRYSRNVGLVSASTASRTQILISICNNTSIRLTITELRPSCGCTSAILGAHAKLPLTLAPGTSVSVKVSIDTFHLTPGKIDKTVAVYAKGNDKPVAILEVTGTILPAVTFSKQVTDFGTLDAGASPSLPLSVEYDRRLDTLDSHVELVSREPEISVDALGAPMPTEDKPQIPGTAIVLHSQRTYTVKFSPGPHIGNRTGKIEAVLRTGDDPHKDVVLSELWVTGQVNGEVSAVPSTIAFGSVALGKAGVQRVVLTGKELDALRIVSASPYVSAHLSGKRIDAARFNRPFGAPAPDTQPRVAASGDNQASTLYVSLAANAPAGTISSTITVFTKHDQMPSIPVYAFVKPSKL